MGQASPCSRTWLMFYFISRVFGLGTHGYTHGYIHGYTNAYTHGYTHWYTSVCSQSLVPCPSLNSIVSVAPLCNSANHTSHPAYICCLYTSGYIYYIYTHGYTVPCILQLRSGDPRRTSLHGLLSAMDFTIGSYIVFG